MATLNKLMVSGVRNFNPNDNPQIVKFSQPVTLFLGENGCGKTTIIECLKYACSGELPGGTNKGQGFVFDPKLIGGVSTKAQVKLRIKAENEDLYTIVKNMTVLVKKGGLTFKKLDNCVKVKNKDSNEESTVSGRCVDVDNFFTDTFGVSRAIINNVIFCHQEDSLWPLEEGSKLKKKFDDIFEVTKSQNFAELMRKSMKKQLEKVKYLKLELLNFEDKKKVAEGKQISLVEKEERKKEYEREVEANEKKLLPILERIKEICNLQNELTRLHETKSGKESEKKMINEQLEDIVVNLKGEEFKGTEEELEKEMFNFDGYFQQLENELDELNAKKTEMETKERLYDKKKMKFLAEVGKLQQEKKNHEEKVNKRKELLEEMEKSLKINLDTEFEKNLNLKTIKDAIDNLRENVKELINKTNKREEELQGKIDICRDNLNKRKHNIETKRSSVDENSKKLREIKTQLEELCFSDDQLNNLNSKVKLIDKDMKSLQDYFDSQNVSQNTIEEHKSKIKKLEEKLEEVEEEMKMLNKNNVFENEIEKTQFEIRKRQNEIIKLKNNHHDNLNIIFENNVPESSLKSALEKLRKEKSAHVNDKINKRNSLNKVLATNEAKLNFAKENLKKLEEELKNGESKLFEVCKGQSYETVKTNAIECAQKLRKDKGQYSSAKLLYEKFIIQFDKEKRCPLCKTEFGVKEKILGEIINDLKSKIREIPTTLRKIEQDLKQKEKEVEKLTELSSVNNKIKELSENQIPNVVYQIEMLDSECENLQSELKTHNEILENNQKIEYICNEILPDITLIDKYQIENTTSLSNIENLKSNLLNIKSNRTISDAETEIENLKMELNNNRRSYENSLKKQHQYNSRCQDLREKKSKLVQQQLDFQEKMQGKPQLEQQKQQLNERNEQLKIEIVDLENSLPTLKTKLTESESTMQEEKLKNKEKIDRAREEFYQNEKLYESLQKITIEIDDYLNKNEEENLFEKTVDILTNVEETLRKMKASKYSIIENINEIKIKQTNQELTLRNLKDNMELIKKRKRKEQLENEIDELVVKIGSYNERTIFKEKTQLEREGGKMNQIINTLNGKMNELLESIKELKSDLEKPELNMAALKYQEKYYEMIITECVAEDLSEFIQGYEFSLTHFHSDRMVEINKLIRDYWRVIYRGNNIDYIEIKTEHQSSKGTRRAYNYKVVQVKDEVEMEMRGRCSAGQKVLASIIIRLALAETFGRKCGILALDEPTTNLDKENMLSLSEALAQIVETKADDKNFQLLIITHDEDFLKALSQINKVDCINRVRRNRSGFSVVQIEKF